MASYISRDNYHIMSKQPPSWIHDFQDKLDNMKTLTNIWFSRGLFIYGQFTIGNPLLIPKLIYVPSLLPTPSNIITQVTHIISPFFMERPAGRKDRQGDKAFSHKVNTLEGGGLKMIDIESMIKALRPARLKKNNGSSI